MVMIKERLASGKIVYREHKPTPRRRSSASPSAKSRQRQQDEAIRRWKAGEISQKEASNIIKNIQRGGGGGIAADPIKFEAAQKALEKEAALKEAQRIAAEQAEAKRIEEAKKQQIIERRTKPTPDIAQQRYIASLRQKTDLEVQPYGGIVKPYGSKDVKWQQPVFGTVTPETTRGYRDVSLFETLQTQEMAQPDISKRPELLYQEQADRIANKIIQQEVKNTQKDIDSFQKDIQKKVDKGMSLDVAKQELASFQESENQKLKDKVEARFDKELTTAQGSASFKSKIKKAEQFREGFAAIDPREIKKKAKERLGTAVDIVAIGASAAAPAVGIAYFGGKGIYQAGKGRGEAVRMADYDPITGKLKTPRYMGEIPSAMEQEAGVNLLFGGLSGVAQTGKIGGQITKQRALELRKQPWSITGRQLSTKGDETVLRVSASKTIGTASAEAEMVLPVKMLKGGKYKILAGRGQVKTRVVDFMRQGTVPKGEEVIKGSMKFNVFGRGSTAKGFLRTDFGNVALKDVGIKVTQGEGYISPDTVQNIKTEMVTKRKWISPKPFDVGTRKELVTTFDYYKDAKTFEFGGISAEADDATKFISGQFSRARLYPKEGRFTGLFKPQSTGEILKPAEKVLKKGFTGGGTKSSKEFFEQLYKQAPQVVKKAPPRAAVVAEQAAPSILSTAEKAVVKTPKTFGFSAFSAAPQLARKSTQILAPLVDVGVTEGLKIERGIKSSVDVGITSKSISQGIDVNPLTGVKPATDFSFSPASDIKTRVTPRLAPKQLARPVFAPGVTPTTPTPIPIPPTRPPLAFGFERKKAVIVKAQGYSAEVLRKGKKWTKLKSPPLTKKSALSAGARYTDRNINARFRIKKVKAKVKGTVKVSRKTGKPIPVSGVVDTKDKYFVQNKRKFRQWRQKGGQRKLIKNQWIERGGSKTSPGFRLDHPNEVRQLQASRGARGFLGGSPRRPPATSRPKAKRRGFRL